jgi:integrase
LKGVLLRGAEAAGYRTELWTLKRIGEVIRKQFGVRYSPVGVWALLRHGLGWSWQKPERRALERDEAAIAQLYGAGLRLLECARLRIKDVDFVSNRSWSGTARGSRTA